MLHLVPAEGTARHVVPLDPHLEFSWHPWQLPAVKGSGTHCQLHGRCWQNKTTRSLDQDINDVRMMQ